MEWDWLLQCACAYNWAKYLWGPNIITGGQIFHMMGTVSPCIRIYMYSYLLRCVLIFCQQRILSKQCVCNEIECGCLPRQSTSKGCVYQSKPPNKLAPAPPPRVGVDCLRSHGGLPGQWMAMFDIVGLIADCLSWLLVRDRPITCSFELTTD